MKYLATSAALISFIASGALAVDRTMQNKARDFVSIEDYKSADISYGQALSNALEDGHQSIYFPPKSTEYDMEDFVEYDYPNPGVGNQDTNAVYSVQLWGCGPDVSRLNWNNSDGIQFNFSSQQHTFQIIGLGFLSGAAASKTGFRVTNSYPFFGSFTSISTFENVTFRGNDGYGHIKLWGRAIYLSNISNVNYNSLSIIGDSNGVTGEGVYLSSPGAGCFANDPTPKTCSTIHNFVNFYASFVQTPLTIGEHTQTVNMINPVFTQCETPIYVPAYVGNTLQGLFITNITSFCFGTTVKILSDLPNFGISGGLITVDAGKDGIYGENMNDFFIGGGLEFISYNAPNVAQSAINIQSNVVGSVGIIDGITASSVGKGVILGADTQDIVVSPSNAFTGLTMDIDDTGDNATSLRYTFIGLRSVGPNTKIGYGSGSGRVFTQPFGAKSNAVTVTTVNGLINTDNSNLNAGASISFDVTAPWCNAEDLVFAQSNNGNYRAQAYGVQDGSFKIKLTNEDSSNHSDVVPIKFGPLAGANS